MKSVKETAIFSFFGVVTSVCVCLIVFVVAMVEFSSLSSSNNLNTSISNATLDDFGSNPHGALSIIRGTGPGSIHRLIYWAGIPSSLAIISFSYGGNIVVRLFLWRWK